MLRTRRRIGAATEIELEDATEMPMIAAAPDTRFASRMAISARRISTKLIAHMEEGAGGLLFRGIQEGWGARRECPASVKGDFESWPLETRVVAALGRQIFSQDDFEVGTNRAAAQRRPANMECGGQRQISIRMNDDVEDITSSAERRRRDSRQKSKTFWVFEKGCHSRTQSTSAAESAPFTRAAAALSCPPASLARLTYDFCCLNSWRWTLPKCALSSNSMVCLGRCIQFKSLPFLLIPCICLSSQCKPGISARVGFARRGRV